MKDTKLHIVYVPIESLYPSPINPRFWSEKTTEDLEDSIRRFGLTEPLLVNSFPKRKNRILSGHFRWTVAKKLGLTTVPVVYINIASEEKERELLLRMNANQGAWDFDLLKSFDIDLLLDVGFDTGDLSSMFDDNLDVEDDEFDEKSEIEKAKETDIKLGDMFSLGKHVLICGDSTDLNTVKKLAGKNKIDLVNIDFPYNINLNYSAGLGGKQHYGGTINDKKSDDEYREFLTKILSNAISVTKDDCHFFAWLDEKYLGTMQDTFKTCGISFKRLCLWAKGSANPTPQIAFNRAVELCMYGVKGKPFLSDKVKNLTEFQNKEISSGNRLIDDIMDIFNIWLVKRLPGNEYEHPTMKPPTLYEKSLRRCSKVGDSVLDLTAGSGSLMVACEALKRRSYLAEIEPVFCQVIINRFKKISNEKVIKLN